ncbi:hypothetical protein CTA1_4638 [Colletotrichum tanaceti]|uniref:Uncharacterized protein n=1 Tax=Colletotrichum tanaceti TaxID=1306861 RepID=A0A4U6X3I6_9PEZI|nr:hypothetical protein CTA1_4638 [Colletotrichum tanaceti]
MPRPPPLCSRIPVPRVGSGASGAAADERSVEFEADDVVVGFRVSRYAYVPASRNPISKKKKKKRKKKKKLVGTGYLENARMHGRGGREEVKVEAPWATYERAYRGGGGGGGGGGGSRAEGGEDIWGDR